MRSYFKGHLHKVVDPVIESRNRLFTTGLTAQRLPERGRVRNQNKNPVLWRKVPGDSGETLPMGKVSPDQNYVSAVKRLRDRFFSCAAPYLPASPLLPPEAR